VKGTKIELTKTESQIFDIIKSVSETIDKEKGICCFRNSKVIGKLKADKSSISDVSVYRFIKKCTANKWIEFKMKSKAKGSSKRSNVYQFGMERLNNFNIEVVRRKKTAAPAKMSKKKKEYDVFHELNKAKKVYKSYKRMLAVTRKEIKEKTKEADLLEKKIQFIEKVIKVA
jgi:hypothetical protein